MNFLYLLAIAPIQIFYHFIFIKAATLFDSYGMALFALSFCNVLLFIPISKFGEFIGRSEKEIQDVLAPQLKDISENYTGNQKHNKIKRLYKRYCYHPIYAIRSVMGVVFQLPFLTAAYLMISSLPEIKGQQFWLINDLSKPDALMYGINLLPLLMTLVNFLTIFASKDMPKKGRIQAIVIALCFAQILYSAPSALLVFWTLNNCVYLIKAIIPHRTKAHVSKDNMFTRFLDKLLYMDKFENIALLCVLFNISFIALFAPSDLFLSDPSFFINGLFVELERTFSLTIAFLIVPFFIWAVSPKSLRLIFTFLLTWTTILEIIFSFIFTRNYGALDINLFANEEVLNFRQLPGDDLKISLTTFLVVLAVYYYKKKQWLTLPLTSIVFALLSYTGYAIFVSNQYLPEQDFHKKTVTIIDKNDFDNSINVIKNKEELPTFSSKQIEGEEYPIVNHTTQYPRLVYPGKLPEYSEELFAFSKNNQNVIVLVLDMFTGGHIEEMLLEDPSLFTALDGFTWYKDTVSVADVSIFSLPTVYGGLNYSPIAFNKRPDEDNIEKWNEAYAVMPKNFVKNGYQVTMANFYNYDREIFERKANSNNILVIEKMGTSLSKAFDLNPMVENSKFDLYLLNVSLFRILPHSFRKYIYDGGYWHGAIDSAFSYSMQETRNELSFFSALSKLSKAKDMEGTLKIYYSMLPHVPWHLPKEGIELMEDPYPKTKGNYMTIGGIIPEHYFAERHIIRLILEFTEMLKKEGIYDNTTIILVSDHCGGDSRMLNKAFGVNVTYEPKHVSESREYNGRPHSLLLVKEANQRGTLQISEKLMTPADVPVFACKPIGGCPEVVVENTDASRKRVHLQGEWRFEKQPQKTYKIKRWHNLSGTMFKKENWDFDIQNKKK